MLILGSMIVGLAALQSDLDNTLVVVKAALEAFWQSYGISIYYVSLVIAVVGSFVGWLPGTRALKH